MTTWLVLGGLVAVVAGARLARRREIFVVSPSEPISTIYLKMARNRDETKAALNAANSVLR